MTSARIGHVGLLFNAFDSNAQESLAAISPPPSELQQININSAVVGLKACGAWDIIASLFVMAGTSGMVDWKRPDILGVLSGSATINPAIGYIGNGAANSHMNTFFAPSDSDTYQLNDASMFLYLHTAPTGNKELCGERVNFSTLNSIVYGSSADGQTQLNAWGFDPINATLGTGWIISQRTASNSVSIYLNNSLVGSGTTASSSLSTNDMWVGEGNGSASGPTDAKISVWGAGGSMNNTQRAGLQSVLNSYLASI
jgi:hypothetical protein